MFVCSEECGYDCKVDFVGDEEGKKILRCCGDGNLDLEEECDEDTEYCDDKCRVIVP